MSARYKNGINNKTWYLNLINFSLLSLSALSFTIVVSFFVCNNFISSLNNWGNKLDNINDAKVQLRIDFSIPIKEKVNKGIAI